MFQCSNKISHKCNMISQLRYLFNIEEAVGWLCDETETQYPNSASFVRILVLPFPTSYLAECGFSAVYDLLLKKRNRLDVTKPGDLRPKLTKLVRSITSLCSRHRAQGSH